MSSLPEAVARPEHTGDQRCWPCTVVNVVVLAVVVLAVGFVNVLAAAAVAVVGAATIAVRGYLVPYTPQFAPKLVAALPVDPFHAGPDPPDAATDGPSDSLSADADGEDVLAALVDAGVVVPDGETLFLDDSFRDAWRTEIATLREMDDDELAEAVADAAPRATGARVDRTRPRRYVVVDPITDSGLDRRRLTMPVAFAEAGAARALEAWIDDPALRSTAAEPLRTFLERCPACDGPVEETTDTRCCGAPLDPVEGPADVLACADCDERLYTF